MIWGAEAGDTVGIKIKVNSWNSRTNSIVANHGCLW